MYVYYIWYVYFDIHLSIHSSVCPSFHVCLGSILCMNAGYISVYCTMYRYFVYHVFVKYIYWSIHQSVYPSICLSECPSVLYVYLCVYVVYILCMYLGIMLCMYAVFVYSVCTLYMLYTIISICPSIPPSFHPSTHPYYTALNAYACVLCLYTMYEYCVCIYNYSQNI